MSGDSIWAFPYNRQDAMNQTLYVRKDWMANLGLEAPKTIDEFYEVMRAFTYDDPDGNGIADTFGTISEPVTAGFGYLRPFAAAFDAIEYKVIDDNVVPPEVTEEYRECLRFLNRLASENILDNEFITYNTQMHVDRLKTGKYGMVGEFWHFDHSPEYLMPDDSRPFGNKIPDTWMTIDFPVRVKDGQPSKIAYSTANRHYLCVSKGFGGMRDVMGFFEWCISEDGTKFNYIGVPGIEYVEENGEIKPLEEKEITQWNYFTPVKQGYFRDGKEKFWMSAGYDSEAIKRLEHAVASGSMDYIAMMLPFDPDLPLFNTDKIRNEYVEKAILGNANLDSDWDTYIANWYSSGGQQVVDFYTDWYQSGGKEQIESMG
jgi:putative aldouronate transport system substrate-binding protein